LKFSDVMIIAQKNTYVLFVTYISNGLPSQDKVLALELMAK